MPLAEFVQPQRDEDGAIRRARRAYDLPELSGRDAAYIAEGRWETNTRAAPRHRVPKAGSIAFGGGATDCPVCNMSATDAAREMMTPLYIPDRFTLIIPTEQFNRPCHVAWRRDRPIGVTFE